jgi:hypothetical protein
VATSCPAARAAATRLFARDLLVRERLTLLLPLGSGRVPDWARPAIRDGHALVFGACWDPLRPILAGHPHVSSANRTGHPPAASPAEARATFPPEVHVLDTDDGSPATGRAATTTLRLSRGHAMTHTRSGAQDRAHGGPDAYLTYLRATREAASPAVPAR